MYKKRHDRKGLWLKKIWKKNKKKKCTSKEKCGLFELISAQSC